MANIRFREFRATEKMQINVFLVAWAGPKAIHRMMEIVHKHFKGNLGSFYY